MRLRRAAPGARAPRAKPRHIESQHAICLMRWVELQALSIPELKWFHAVPNGGDRGAIEAKIMKAEGVRAGVWDYSLPVCRAGFAGLIIELKAPGRQNEKNGGLSDKQVEYRDFQRAQNRLAVVCYDWEEAVHAVKTYLGGTR